MRILSSLIILSCLLFSGCVALLAGGAGAGAATYVAGQLNTTIEKDIDTVWLATRDAVDDLRFDVKIANQDAAVGKIVSKNAVGDEITIYLKRVSPNITELSVRVGLLGDRTQSELILSKINGRISQ